MNLIIEVVVVVAVAFPLEFQFKSNPWSVARPTQSGNAHRFRDRHSASEQPCGCHGIGAQPFWEPQRPTCGG